ncbi:MAG: protein-methionine-sulfoxide reductase catalytic subunit MsrP [Chloroflexota bacterium]
MEKKLKHIGVPSSEITPQREYISRRDFLKAMGILTAASLLAACAPQNATTNPAVTGAPDRPLGLPPQMDELGTQANTFEEITNYNNYYEFSTDKGAVASLSQGFRTRPWTVEVGGLVHKPKVFDIEELLQFEQVERVYRLRCVEAWSMVIPWTGFELNRLLREVEPMSSAKYVRFVTIQDEEQMPGLSSRFYPWPYTEGLRLDEAMHRLTLMATGLYGQPLPNPNGSPLRLVVPWKYGFKSIKAIVRIELTEELPETFWNDIAPQEYGFYSNVNPQVDHPRWTQSSERRIGELSRRETLMFNGYGEEVASLYADMNLSVNY